MSLSEAILSIPALMIAVILHEVAHGWMAYKWGDPTAKLAGRLNFRDLRKGTFFTSIAGVAMNLSLAVVFGALYRVIYNLSDAVDPFLAQSVMYPLLIFCAKSVMINLILALFNIIPIPPLDGSRALMSFLSFKYWEIFYRYEVYGFFVITILLFTGILGRIIYPPLVFLYHLILGGA